MKKKVMIICLLTAVLFVLFFITYFSLQKITLNEVLIQNNFDINKVENFEIYQNSYNWYTTESSSKNISDIQDAIKYFDQIANIQLSEHKPLFKKSKYFFDYYNYTSMISLKFTYDDRQLFMTFHNTDFGVCNIIANDNGNINKYNLYFESFEDFLFNN